MSETNETPTTPEAAPQTDLRKVLETLLFITDHPMTLSEIAKIAGVKADVAEPVLKAIQADYEENHRPQQVLEIAEGYQMASRPEYAPFVRKLYTDRLSFRLSQAALETLSIIAYKQPITRAEVEDLRGVEVIAALETLLEKRLIKVAGRKEVVGRPILYGTTLEFLRHFGLKSLQELPNLDTFTAPPAVEGAGAANVTSAVSAPVDSGEPVALLAEAAETETATATLEAPVETPVEESEEPSAEA